MRPDKAYARSIVSQYMYAPRVPHLEAVERILRYLEKPRKDLLFGNHRHMKIKRFIIRKLQIYEG